jgi:hypothetical protein
VFPIVALFAQMVLRPSLSQAITMVTSPNGSVSVLIGMSGEQQETAVSPGIETDQWAGQLPEAQDGSYAFQFAYFAAFRIRSGFAFPIHTSNSIFRSEIEHDRQKLALVPCA